jgi:hypothetical protein
MLFVEYKSEWLTDPPAVPLCLLPGFLLGTRQTLLETVDGGKTWQPRDIEAAKDEGFNYRWGEKEGLSYTVALLCIQPCQVEPFGARQHPAAVCLYRQRLWWC